MDCVYCHIHSEIIIVNITCQLAWREFVQKAWDSRRSRLLLVNVAKDSPKDVQYTYWKSAGVIHCKLLITHQNDCNSRSCSAVIYFPGTADVWPYSPKYQNPLRANSMVSILLSISTIRGFLMRAQLWHIGSWLESPLVQNIAHFSGITLHL
jgi:hypothetical protein